MSNYPDSYRGATRREVVLYCKECGEGWEVQGEVDFGAWEPDREQDLQCPECGEWCDD